MKSTAEFRKGLRIEMNGEPFLIVDFQHVKPGKGGAFVRTRLKSLVTGNVIEHTFRSGEKVEEPDLEEQRMQFLYEDAGTYCFMDLETFEQRFFTAEHLGTTRDYLTENLEVSVLFHRGRPLAVEPPLFVSLRVVETDPGVRGDTASGGSKPARLQSGAMVQVPLFITVGDVIKVDTRTGDYIERVG